MNIIQTLISKFKAWQQYKKDIFWLRKIIALEEQCPFPESSGGVVTKYRKNKLNAM